MTPFRWMSDETLRRVHHRANLCFKVPTTVAICYIPLMLWQDWLVQPLGYLGLGLIVFGLIWSIPCQWCWREAERRDLDPVEWAKGIGWWG